MTRGQGNGGNIKLAGVRSGLCDRRPDRIARSGLSYCVCCIRIAGGLVGPIQISGRKESKGKNRKSHPRPEALGNRIRDLRVFA